MKVPHAACWVVLLVVGILVRTALSEDVIEAKTGNPGTVTCKDFCVKPVYPGYVYRECSYTYDTKQRKNMGCGVLRGYSVTYPVICYCKGRLYMSNSTTPVPVSDTTNTTTSSTTTTTTTTTTKVLDCSKVHKACETCKSVRISGTKKTDTVCSTCFTGWRLRQDNIYKTCDCAPGLTMNGTFSLWDASIWCVPCSKPNYCEGGSVLNPTSAASTCPVGLATISDGAKAVSQCFTAPGYGRITTTNGTETVISVQICPVGTYNVGGNTAGCQNCQPGLITVAPGATNISACVAPAGYFVDRGVAKICPKGTYTPDYNSYPTCIVCPTGLTTLAEGSNTSLACNRVSMGYYLVNATTAEPCPLGSYQNQEGTIYACNDCPYGYITRSDGAGGNAECMAPPGWELKPGADHITECEIGWYKEGWNKNPCLPCGPGLTTEKVGALSYDGCRVPPGYGIVSMLPSVEAKMCDGNTYGVNVSRAVVISSRCTPCAANLFTRDVLSGENATSGYLSELDCLLKPGYGLTQSGTVELCQEGTYNDGYNRQACRECPTAYTSVGTGADSADACVVQSGWALDPAHGLPKPCEQGSYSTGGTSENPQGNCTLCPVGFTTQRDESYAPGDCNVCSPGYGGTYCDICPHNTFATGGQAEGTPCIPCAPGSVSARQSRDNTQCYQSLIDAEKDYFPLSDDSKWTNDNAATSLDCQEACRTDNACVMYRFSTDQSAPKCQVLLEAPEGSQMIGLKAGAADYAFYKMDAALTVGVLVSDEGNKTPQECMAACGAAGACELVSLEAANLPATAGPCKLYRSDLDSDWIGMVHIQGNKLYSDMLITA